jgi:hypothetical protein
MNNRLYIIGNGFDIHHGIKSRYSDFKIYVYNKDKELFDALGKYFNPDELWSDFEETLAYLDTDTIKDDKSGFIKSYGAEDWSDAYHHDYQYEIQQTIDLVTVRLRIHFTEWILQLNPPPKPILILDNNSRFLTFNYTSTLENTYGIKSENILYIHNKAINSSSLLILGHSRRPLKENKFRRMNDEDTDVRVVEGNVILDKYFETTYKNTETIIRENQAFFNDLKDVDEVFILGHSISDVDIKYFQLIKSKVKECTIWTVSYYEQEQKLINKLKVVNLGVCESIIEMIKLEELNYRRRTIGIKFSLVKVVCKFWAYIKFPFQRPKEN